MNRLAHLLALLFFLSSPLFGDVNLAKGELQVVEETYDEVIVIDRDGWSSVWFIRDGKKYGERRLEIDMNWTVQDGEFILDWNDYGHCYRVIRFNTYSHMQVPITRHDDGGRQFLPWWAMGRNMGELKQPER
jgi:hypothetical protein